MSDAEFTLRFTEEGLGAISGDLGELAGHMNDSAVVGGVLGGVIAEIGMKAIEMGAEATEAVAEVAVEFGKAIVEASAFQQRMAMAFGNLLDGSAAGDAALQRTIDLAAQLGMNVEQTTDAYRGFLAAQIAPAEATNLVKMTGDLQAAGVQAQELQSVMLALKEVQDVGTLQGRQLRMLEIAGVPGSLVREKLAEELQMSDAGVEKAMSKNKIKADVAFKAVEDAVAEHLHEAKLGDAAQQFADNTLTGMWSKLQANWQKGMLDIGKAVAPALTDAFKPIFDDLMGWMQGDAGKTFITEVVAGVKELGTIVQAVWPFVKQLVGGLGEGFEATVPIIKDVGKGLGQMMGSANPDTARELGKALGYMAGGVILVTEALVGGALLFGRYIGVLEDTAEHAYDFGKALVGGIAGPALEAVHWVAQMKDEIVGDLYGLVNSAESIGTGLIDGLIGGITGGIGRVVSAAKNLASQVEGGIKGALGIHSPSTVFHEIGLFTAAGMEGGIDAGAPDVRDAAIAMAPAPSMFSAGPTATSTTTHSGANVTINVNVNAPAGAPGTQQFASDLAQEIRRGIAAELRAALAPS